MNKKITLSLFLGIILSFYSLDSVLAQEVKNNQGLTISPFLFERKMEKGETFEESIKIFNNSEVELPVSISVSDFVPDGENGQVKYLNPSEADKHFSLSTWIKFINNPQTSLKPKESTELKFSITPPSDAEEGGHYGAILFSMQPTQVEGSAVAVQQKLAAIILVKLGKVQEDGQITKFSTKQNVYQNTPIDFITRFRNTGNVHLKPRGSIAITNLFGKLVGNIQVNENSGNVLANSERELFSSWHGNFAFGYYSAEIKLVYGDSGQVILQKISFWVLPFKIILIVTIIIILFIIVFSWLVKKYNRWIIKKASQK